MKTFYSVEELRELFEKKQIVTMTPVELQQLFESEEWKAEHADNVRKYFH